MTFLSGSEQKAVYRQANRSPTLIGRFKLNSEYGRVEGERQNLSGTVDPRVLFYQLPKYISYMKDIGVWNPRKKKKPFPRRYRYGRCLEEAPRFQIPSEHRARFSCTLAFCVVSARRQIYECFRRESLIDKVSGDRLSGPDTLSEPAILAPCKINVNNIYEEALDKLSGSPEERRSTDDVINAENDETDYTTVFLNSLLPVSLPPYHLEIKKDATVMLLRNLDVGNALCSGARLTRSQHTSVALSLDVALLPEKEKKISFRYLVLITTPTKASIFAYEDDGFLPI
ncbi:hypothetical protein OESDEN_02403 [Oesophagostomum dentatum]|uniref:DNA helicase Pif1-like 2B domain-containing protein n=1 Tax=Oesophagostomum dentatum TaxID=61180 RepID=A0A0B1TNG9_OESDE|nr:hypothetical protein OESDEN_02403 [Oesophagostomum dentatum]